MGDDDSRTKGSGLRVDDSSESLESLPNRDEQWENVGEDPSKSGRRRLKSISMSDLDIEHHPSDNMQESRNKKSTSASDLKDKPQDGDNMQNYPVYRINMGGTEPSLTESGFVAEGSCWPTPSESFQTFYNSQQSRICENPWTNSLPRRHLDRSYTGDTWSSLTKSGFVTGGSSKATHPDTMCNIEEHNNNSDSPSKTPREEKSLLDRCGDSDVEEEKKQRKKSRSCCRRSARMPLWLIIGFLVIFCAITAVLLALLSRGAVMDSSSNGPPCEKSWIWVGDRCYYFSDTTNSWNDSRDFCTRHGSSLAVLMDQEINKTIQRYRENVNYWIGLSMGQKERWMWTDGSLYNGSVANQDSQHLRCAFLNSHLVALACSSSRQWICVQDSA